ncbi:hypothetical protein Bca52824_010794 [Brassica carinata]|uniref:Uncharacterized protein n=1 Tax=Brassica carinata TaxID=52824 RepID=A0A8X7WDD3_BRACI|nr:hypothetical protein Bca52824_010794 [Brassica carinata]
MAFAGEVAVFVETNLGTRIAITVSLDFTSADFKRKVEETHVSCLPSLGEIRVHSLMVQRKSQFYYLAQSVPIKYIFRDNHSKPWFIHAEATLVNRSQEPSISNRFGIGHCSASDQSPHGVVVHDVNNKTKKSLAKPIPKPSLEDKEREFVDSFTTEPETIVRSSLSTARAAELNSKCFMPKTPEWETGETASISKKLIVAANNIRMQGKSYSLSSSIFRSKNRRKRCIDGKTLASLAKFMVFEIPDTED